MLSFTPQPSFGSSSPKYSDQTCYGIDLRNALAEGHVPKPEMNIGWIIEAYNAYPENGMKANVLIDKRYTLNLGTVRYFH